MQNIGYINKIDNNIYITSDEEFDAYSWVITGSGELCKMNNSKYLEYLESLSMATKKVVCSSNPNLKLTVLTEQTIKNIEHLKYIVFERGEYLETGKLYISIYENDKLLGCSN